MPSGVAAGDLIKGAARLVNVIATSETLTADELNDGLATLNDLLELWSTQNLAVYGAADVTFNTVAAQASYTLGPTGTWVGDRPVRINDWPSCRVSGVDFPIELIGEQDYNLIPLKTQPGQIIERMLYVNDFPNGRVTLWPVPSAVVPITFSVDRILTQVPNVATLMTFPPGYLLAMRYQLGIMLAPDYGRTVTEEVAAVARSSFAAIKRANKVRRTAGFDAGLVGHDGPVTYQRGY